MKKINEELVQTLGVEQINYDAIKEAIRTSITTNPDYKDLRNYNSLSEYLARENGKPGEEKIFVSLNEALYDDGTLYLQIFSRDPKDNPHNHRLFETTISVLENLQKNIWLHQFPKKILHGKIRGSFETDGDYVPVESDKVNLEHITIYEGKTKQSFGGTDLDDNYMYDDILLLYLSSKIKPNLEKIAAKLKIEYDAVFDIYIKLMSNFPNEVRQYLNGEIIEAWESNEDFRKQLSKYESLRPWYNSITGRNGENWQLSSVPGYQETYEKIDSLDEECIRSLFKFLGEDGYVKDLYSKEQLDTRAAVNEFIDKNSFETLENICLELGKTVSYEDFENRLTSIKETYQLDDLITKELSYRYTPREYFIKDDNGYKVKGVISDFLREYKTSKVFEELIAKNAIELSSFEETIVQNNENKAVTEDVEISHSSEVSEVTVETGFVPENDSVEKNDSPQSVIRAARRSRFQERLERERRENLSNSNETLSQIPEVNDTDFSINSSLMELQSKLGEYLTSTKTETTDTQIPNDQDFRVRKLKAIQDLLNEYFVSINANTHANDNDVQLPNDEIITQKK